MLLDSASEHVCGASNFAPRLDSRTLSTIYWLIIDDHLTMPSADKLHLACPHCLRENRLPAERLEQHPLCGKCGTPLLHDKPLALNEQSFDAFIKPDGLPVVVDFWAPWCGPCRAMAPEFERAAKQLITVARFAKVNSDEAQGLASRFGIRSIPTLILFRHARELKRVSGAMDARSLVQWVQS